MHRGARHAKLFLRDTGTESQARERHHGVGIRVFFDQSIYLRNRRHDHLCNHLEALAQMPQFRIGDGRIGLLGGANGQKSDSLSLDQRLENRIGQNRRPVTAGFERRAERDKRVHVARAAHGRQQDVKGGLAIVASLVAHFAAVSAASQEVSAPWPVKSITVSALP